MNHRNMFLWIIACLNLAVSSVSAEETAPVAGKTMIGRAGFDILIGDVDAYAIARYTGEGKRVWDYSEVRAIDVWPLSDGNVLVAFLPSDKTANKSGVRIVSSDKKTIFEYLAPEGEVMSCCPVSNGNILVAETQKGRVVEVDRKGAVVSAFEVKAKDKGHSAIRMIRLTPEGTVLVAEYGSQMLREYARDGKFVREFPVEHVYFAQRLENGNTLAVKYTPATVVELDREGKMVWQVGASDLPADLGIEHFCEVRRLPNGNTMITNCIRKSVKDKAVLFEITPDKKVVWQLRDSEVIKGITSAKPISL